MNEAPFGQRGDRSVKYIDFSTAEWTHNEFGVDVLILSRDELSGAVTMALRTPANLHFPEEAHFYDCDQDLFQFEGEFHHDEELPFHEGDYVYRPPGTVYGNSVGSSGGLIVAALNRRPVRFHFQDHPEPWTGEYLVDRFWNSQRQSSQLIKSSEVPWTSCSLGTGLDVKKLRGEPGKLSEEFGSRAHSPWGADSAFMLRIPEGFDDQIPTWPNTILEALATEGKANINGQDWHRGCYSFGHLHGHCRVTDALTLYVRAFREL